MTRQSGYDTTLPKLSIILKTPPEREAKMSEKLSCEKLAKDIQHNVDLALINPADRQALANLQKDAIELQSYSKNVSRASNTDPYAAVQKELKMLENKGHLPSTFIDDSGQIMAGKRLPGSTKARFEDKIRDIPNVRLVVANFNKITETSDLPDKNSYTGFSQWTNISDQMMPQPKTPQERAHYDIESVRRRAGKEFLIEPGDLQADIQTNLDQTQVNADKYVLSHFHSIASNDDSLKNDIFPDQLVIASKLTDNNPHNVRDLVDETFRPRSLVGAFLDRVIEGPAGHVMSEIAQAAKFHQLLDEKKELLK